MRSKNEGTWLTRQSWLDPQMLEILILLLREGKGDGGRFGRSRFAKEGVISRSSCMILSEQSG